MTAFEDKLQQAGADTLGAQFYTRAVEAIKAATSTRDAWRLLGERWGIAALTRIQADMKSGDPLRRDTLSSDVSHESGGHQAPDTQTVNAAALTSSGDHPVADTQHASVSRAGGGGQKIGDTHLNRAAASTKPKTFFRQKPKSDIAKQTTRSAMLAGSSMWRDLHMERLRYREIPAFIREQVIAGGNHARKAHWETKRAAVAYLVQQHITPTDESAFVKDCVTAKQAAKFATIADSQAALIVSKIVQQTAREIESGVKLIAAE